MSIAYGGDQITFPDASTQNTGATGFGFKNRIINGAMVISQRDNGASVTPTSGQFLVDRWQYAATQASKFTAQQTPSATETGFATRVSAGFTNYQALTVASAVSVGAGDTFYLKQTVEGFNVADLAWGTANAKTITLSFLAYSSLTGTFGGSLFNSSGARSYPFSYLIPTANTWTQISVTIAGDTSGTWLTTNGIGVAVNFGLGSGSTFTTTANAWAAGTYVQPNSTVSVVGTSGATFYITGVQLEKGSTATSFDYRPYGTELALCQRYFAKLNNDGTGGDVTLGCGFQQSTIAGVISINFPVTMRVEPTVVISNLVSTDLTAFANAATASSINMGYNTGSVGFSFAAAGALGRAIFLAISGGTSGFLSLSSEL
jgi:hypothetical protein